MIKFNSLMAASVCTLSISSVNAASTSYFSQAGFLAALGSADSVTHNFDSMAAGSIIADGDTINGATFNYNLAGNPSIVVYDDYATTSANNYLGTSDGSGAFVSGDSFTINFDQTMQAIGLYVISADLIFANDFILTTNSGHSVRNTSTVDVSLVDGDAYFISFIEDDFSLGFDSITLNSFDAGFLFNVDDITVSAVPLPAAIWLMGSGLVFLSLLSRRKKQG